MAVPFRKISKTRGRMRRTHYKIEAANTVVCKNCGDSIKPHRVCPECGFYKGNIWGFFSRCHGAVTPPFMF